MDLVILHPPSNLCEHGRGSCRPMISCPLTCIKASQNHACPMASPARPSGVINTTEYYFLFLLFLFFLTPPSLCRARHAWAGHANLLSACILMLYRWLVNVFHQRACIGLRLCYTGHMLANLINIALGKALRTIYIRGYVVSNCEVKLLDKVLHSCCTCMWPYCNFHKRVAREYFVWRDPNDGLYLQVGM
jgi:hypothetical protein